MYFNRNNISVSAKNDDFTNFTVTALVIERSTYFWRLNMIMAKFAKQSKVIFEQSRIEEFVILLPIAA